MITKEEAVKNHRILWHEIARRTREEQWFVSKEEVLADLWPDVEIRQDCWCCEYTAQFEWDCSHCPVIWGEDPKMKCVFAEYNEWRLAKRKKDWEKVAFIADKIAELPERENV